MGDAAGLVFVSWLLGLVLGPQTVELAARGPISRVELHLDRQLVATQTDPPYRFDVDLGGALEPHHLEARGFDARGRLLVTTEQWVNMPKPVVAIEIELLDRPGPPQGDADATVRWQAIDGEPPESISLRLDGRELPLRNGTATLPPAADDQLARVLSAEARFRHDTVARRDVVLTQTWNSDVSTELQAVPVLLRDGATLPKPEEAAAQLRVEGQPAKVAAVEVNTPNLVVVRSEPARKFLAQMFGAGYGGRALSARWRNWLLLPRNATLRFIWPWPQIIRTAPNGAAVDESAPGASALPVTRLFDRSESLDRRSGNHLFQLINVVNSLERSGPASLADAVAVAGLEAAGSDRPRAVLLLIHDDHDPSRHPPARVRAFLDALAVPLVVWSTAPTSPAAAAWEAEDISDAQRMREASTSLGKQLRAQRIVWIAGRHRPTDVAVIDGGPLLPLVAARAASSATGFPQLSSPDPPAS